MLESVSGLAPTKIIPEVGVAVAVGVEVGVGDAPWSTVTLIEAAPRTVPVALKAVADSVWGPFGTVVVSQL